MCYSSTLPGMSYHVTQFYQAFSRVSTASDKCWGEKVWVQGYFNPGLLSEPTHQVREKLSSSVQSFSQVPSSSLLASPSSLRSAHSAASTCTSLRTCMLRERVFKSPYRRCTQTHTHTHTHTHAHTHTHTHARTLSHTPRCRQGGSHPMLYNVFYLKYSNTGVIVYGCYKLFCCTSCTHIFV